MLFKGHTASTRRSYLCQPFTADEIDRIVRETPADRVLGPDGFTGVFFKATWEVVGPDIIRVFHSLWQLDFRSFYHLNEATMVLINKNESPEGLKDYRPINLIHSVGKLFAKGLALRLTPRMPEIFFR